jgi:hypothetical protein
MPQPSDVLTWVRTPDRLRAASTGAASALLFLLTFSPNVSLGDSPESIAGIKSFGILHSPGYPAYVILGKLFTTLLPFGPLALRVNLFSVVCAVATVVCLYWLARRAGASGTGAVVGALTLATGTAFWFYAGFAKHYALSGLLLVVAILEVLRWIERGDWRMLAVAGVALGLAAGASWQLTALTALAMAILVFVGGRRPTVRDLAAAVAGGLVVMGFLGLFVLVRAGQEPALNWGRATSVDRLEDLVLMKDFGLNVSPDSGGGNPGRQAVTGSDVSRAPFRVLAYVVLLVREFSLLALIVAAIGSVASWRRKGRRSVAAFFTVLFFLNLTAAGIVVGVGIPVRFNDVLAHGGFLAAATTTMAVWVALGVTGVEGLVAKLASGGGTSARTRAERRRAQRRDGKSSAASDVGVIAACVAGAIVIVPAVVSHAPVAQHRLPHYASNYATNVLDQLPEDAVVFVWGAERMFPLIEAQVVDARRPDVDVVNANGLSRPWYREQVARMIGAPVADEGETGVERAVALAGDVERRRPVYLDAVAMRLLRNKLPFRAVGLVGDVGADASSAASSSERLLGEVYDTGGVYDDPARARFPNRNVVFSYEQAHLELARIYLAEKNEEKARTHIERALQINPNNTQVREFLADLDKR